MESLLKKIETRLTYIESNTTNEFLLNQVNIQREKMKYFADRYYETKDVVDDAVSRIINRDVKMMNGVPDQTNMVYKKMDEYADFVSEIPSVYFE